MPELGSAERQPLATGWQVARSAAGAWADPAALASANWSAARVPGTASGALGGDDGRDFDAEDWWFRVDFHAQPVDPGEEVWLELAGLATVAEVYLNAEPILASDSMFARHSVEVSDLLRGENSLLIVCRALQPRLAERRRPRQRWRTRLVSQANLRFFRTMLLGRAPGFSPGPAVVGPWRGIGLVRRRGTVLDSVRFRARLDGQDGVVSCAARVRVTAGATMPAVLNVELAGPTGRHAGTLAVGPDGEGHTWARGQLRVTRPALWWPHTHGTPVLYEVRIADADRALSEARVGFRTLRAARPIADEGLGLEINGVQLFARGAVWTPGDLTAPSAPEAVLRPVLDRVCAAGMNMLRIAGIGAYESDAFHDLCDELGILVWQDFMFANLDYPESDPDFMSTVTAEATQVLAELGGRPSLAVLCGSSEVAQQVTMLGLDPALASGPLYSELLPRLIAAAEVDAPYVPSTPWGGALPFRTDRGVANYYGVGAYRRPLEDVRRADVRFAAECLAFANVPDEAALEDLAGPGIPPAHDPAWKAGVPRDAGAGWDFDDVRDHYLGLLFGVDAVELRSVDPERYRELSRAVTGEAMAEVLGEWRRSGSPCAGALLLWLQDHRPGAGWGLLDHRGEPKVAYHHLRRAFAPIAVWSTDEGLGGVTAHVANDRGETLSCALRVALYRDFEHLVAEVREPITLAPRTSAAHDLEALLGGFVDVNWAYRFGPPAQDLISLSLERDSDRPPELLAQSFRFPVGRPLRPEAASSLGLSGELRAGSDGEIAVAVRSRRFAYGVRPLLPGRRPVDDAFGIEPGHERVVLTEPAGTPAEDSNLGTLGTLSALNLIGRVPLADARAPRCSTLS